MARRLINALAETGRCSAAYGSANVQILGSLSCLLPAASLTLSGSSCGQASVLMQQQQQYSSSNTHICSQHCSCNLQSASSLTKLQSRPLSWSLSSSTRLGLGAGSHSSSSLLPATAARAFASFSGASAHAGCGECLKQAPIQLSWCQLRYAQAGVHCMSALSRYRAYTCACTCTACTDSHAQRPSM
jgi:hypothetical protein